MRRGNRNCRRTVNRIHPRGENFQRRIRHLRHREFHPRPARLADPVSLHRQHAFRPAALQLLHVVQQLIRILRDAEKPLFQLAALHQRGFMPPAKSVDHLLVGQHRTTRRAPVHFAFLAERQALLVHPQKQPLVPAVIFRIAGRKFPTPVVAESKPPQHPPELDDIFLGPFPRRHFIFDRRIFRRQTERIPAHRVQHVESAHALVTRHRVANRVIAHVAHVQSSGGVRQHFEEIIFGA